MIGDDFEKIEQDAKATATNWLTAPVSIKRLYLLGAGLIAVGVLFIVWVVR